MLLAIDMGNTQTALGLFDGDELVRSWRMPTDRSFTADEIHMRLLGFFQMYGISLDVVDAIANTRRGPNDKPIEPQVMKKVTVETFGVEYPEPEKC